MTATICRALLAALVVVAPPSAIKPGTSTADIIAKLRALPADEPYAWGQVPEGAPSLLRELKHRLRDEIRFVLNSMEGTPLVAPEIRSAIAERLEVQGITVGDEPSREKELGYGYVVDVDVTTPAGHTDMVAATTVLSVTCGNDTSLYLFQRKGEGWTPALALEANDYGDINGAQGMFDFRVSRPDGHGSFFIVTTEVGPWCTSCWQTLRYSVLRVGPTASEPLELDKGEYSFYECSGYELGLTSNGFVLEFQVWSDDNDLTKTTVSFTVDGDRVTRDPERR